MMTVLGVMPVLGILMLAVVLLTMTLRRERWIVPGLVCSVLVSAGLSAAIEYRDDMTALFNRPSAAATVAEPVPPSDEPDYSEPELDEPARPDDRAYQPPPSPRSVQPAEPAPAAHGLVPVTDDRRSADDRGDGRRTVVVAPGWAPIRQPPTAPGSQPAPAASPRTVQPTPAPATSAPVSTRPPATAPAVAVVEVPRTAQPEPVVPKPIPASPGPGGMATLTIKIKGPLVETSTKPVQNPHIMIILDGGKRVESRPPTRVVENHKDDDPNQPVIAYTYFWENVTVSFSSVDAGWHVVMIDTSLDNPRTHQSAMTGSGQDSNDYNGSIELKSGESSVMEFGAKNWLNGQLGRIR